MSLVIMNGLKRLRKRQKMESKVSNNMPDTFQILFRDFCPYCHSRTPGIHTCPGTQEKLDEIAKEYEGWRYNA